MTEQELAKPLAEDALVETVAKALYEYDPYIQRTWFNFEERTTGFLKEPRAIEWGELEENYARNGWNGKLHYKALATAAIAAVRAHDAGMPCGHCTPNSDEVRCACQIEENRDAN